MLKNKIKPALYSSVVIVCTGCTSVNNLFVSPDANFKGATSIKRLTIPSDLSTPAFDRTYDVSYKTGADTKKLSDDVPLLAGLKGTVVDKTKPKKPVIEIVKTQEGTMGVLFPLNQQQAWKKLKSVLTESGFAVQSSSSSRYETIWKGEKLAEIANLGGVRFGVEQSFLEQGERHIFTVDGVREGGSLIEVLNARGQRLASNDAKKILEHIRDFY